MTQKSLKHLQRLLAAAAAAFLAMALVSVLWASAAQANPSPSTTPSVAPTPGITGLYMFTNTSGFTKELRQINTTDGDASLAFPVTTTQNLTGVAQHPSTGIVWAVTGNCNLYSVNMTTGALNAATPSAVIPPSPYTGCETLAINGDGILYVGLSNTSITPTAMTWGTVDITTGAATVRWNPLSPPESVTSMSYDPATNAVYYFAVRGAAPTYYAWFKIQLPYTVLSTSSNVGSTPLAFTPSGVAYTDAVDRSNNANDFLAGTNTFIGYPNGQTAYNDSLFWYQAPATASPTPALAATGSPALPLVLLACVFLFAGTSVVAALNVIRRKRMS